MAPYTIDGVQLTEAQVEALVKEREARRDRWTYWRQRLSQDWYYRTKEAPGSGQIWEDGRWRDCTSPGDCTSAYRRDGTVREITEAECMAAITAPTFAVGDWVQRTASPWAKPKAVTFVPKDNGWVDVQDETYVPTALLRHATPEEIATAKRIELRDRVIVRGHNAGTVWQWRQHRQRWRCLSDDELKPALQLWALDTDHYTVLDSYTVQGAKA